MAKEELYKKCFPYSAVVKVPSLVKHAVIDEKYCYQNKEKYAEKEETNQAYLLFSFIFKGKTF